MRRLLTALALVLAVGPALAQEATVDGGRIGHSPSEMPAPAPTELPDPNRLDPSRLAPSPVDAAYGAFQRGYYLTALNRATPLALAGNPAAQTLIGEIYLQGLGVRRDIATATEWYEKAATQGVAEAQFQLGMIFLDGGAEFGDRKRAAELLQQAADVGNRLAQFNYAQLLLSDDATIKGEERAVSYFEKAAKAGLADAQYAMAQVHREGAGGKAQDEAELRRWLEQAARQGHPPAQIELGSMLAEALEEKSQKEGFSWLMRAAAAGNPAAQNRVAKLYRAGVGVEPDRIAAASWYLRARRGGLVDPLMEDQLEGLTEAELRLATLNSDRLQ